LNDDIVEFTIGKAVVFMVCLKTAVWLKTDAVAFTLGKVVVFVERFKTAV
jgi:hypothetical protein